MRLLHLICVASAAFMLAPMTNAKTIFPGEGSPGDGTVEVECPRGEVLAGFSGNTGEFIDKIQIHCAPLLAGGVTGEPQPRGQPRGGDGGQLAEQNCPAGSRVGTLSVLYNGDRKQALGVSLNCGGDIAIEMGLSPDTSTFTGDPFHRTNYTCGAAGSLTGLVISSGKHVNSIGVICDAVAAAPPPLRKTGRAPKPSAEETAAREAEAALIIADRQVTGKTAAECEVSYQRCQSRCYGQTLGNYDQNLLCTARECTPIHGQCMAIAAQDPDQAGGGGANPLVTVEVIQSVDLYTGKFGEGGKIGVLRAGASGVVLVQPCADDWCQVESKGGSGWVYNGADYRSLRIP